MGRIWFLNFQLSNSHYCLISILCSGCILIEIIEYFIRRPQKIDAIFIVDLTVTTYCQIDSEDLVNFGGLLRKREHYQITYLLFCMS